MNQITAKGLCKDFNIIVNQDVQDGISYDQDNNLINVGTLPDNREPKDEEDIVVI